MISHGNGPQVGLLALQGAAYTDVETYPLDVLGAQTEGMIGYMIEQELGNLLPFEQPFATLLTMVEVDPDDPAFQRSDQVHRPGLRQAEAERLAAEKGWAIKPDGDKWRRVVASPLPKRIFEIRPIHWLLEQGAVVICAGGGGIPTMYEPGTRPLVGAEVVIDKDRASALLAARARGGPVRDGDRRRRASTATGARRTSARSGGRRRASSRHRRSPAARWDRRSRRRSTSSAQTGNRAAIGTLADIRGVVAGTQGNVRSSVADDRAERPAAGEPGQVARRRRFREPEARGNRSSSIAILIVLITMTVALFGTDATGGPLQVALILAALAPVSWRCAWATRARRSATRRSAACPPRWARSSSCSRSGR